MADIQADTTDSLEQIDIIEGGQAFPCPRSEWEEGNEGQEETFYQPAQAGMTVRTYLAAQAMKGMLANSEILAEEPNYIADWSVTHADALIDALELEDPKED